MDTLLRAFERLGFGAHLTDRGGRPPRNVPHYRVAVVRDKKGREMFDIGLSADAEATVIDVRPEEQALLLMIRGGPGVEQVKMLCGHDECQLFVATVPPNAVTVRNAMQALKPPEIVAAEQATRVRGKQLHRRRNRARLRQGDFFFLPSPELKVQEKLVRKNEPINRGRGRSHIVEYAYTVGGEAVWVCRQYPNGVTPREYARILDTVNGADRWGWQPRTRDATVYARGRVSHPEHRTIVLREWHRVLPNTENRFRGFDKMAFID